MWGIIFSAATLVQLITSALALDQQIDAKLNKNEIQNVRNQAVDSKKFPREPSLSGLEPRVADQTLAKDIIDRLHNLDTDIDKLLNSSTPMYSAPTDAAAAPNDPPAKQEKFSEVLTDLDSLQDEIGVLVNNATRTRQYNMLVRLRPLNTLLYRIRHNLHLMRNSLVAINTVSHLERLGNSVLDSTLQAFLKPDADANEELGDTGNYDISLDKAEDLQPTVNSTQNFDQPEPSAHTTNSSTVPAFILTGPSAPTTTSTTTTTTTTTTAARSTSTSTTTPAPVVSTRSPILPQQLTSSTSNLSQTEKPLVLPSSKRPGSRPGNRRTSNRGTRRNSTTTIKPSTTTKPARVDLTSLN